jgi:hypothetical protein
MSRGAVSNPGERYEAVLFGDQGVFKIRGEKSTAVPVPLGEWKLLSYTIEASAAGRKRAVPAGEKKASRPSSGEKEQQRPLQDRLLPWLAEGGLARLDPFRQRVALVSAQWPKDYPAVKVQEGKTALLPFGPPYKAVVDVSYTMGDREVSLGMRLVGSAGETCTNLLIEGAKPATPTFELRTAGGKPIESGKFEYG